MTNAKTVDPATPMSNSRKVTITSSGRLDKRLAGHLNASRSEIQRWIKKAHVSVNGEVITKKSYQLSAGSTVTVSDNLPDDNPIEPENGPLNVLYEDNQLLAVEKRHGVLVHPTPSRKSGTLANWLLYHYPELEGVGKKGRAGLVHRLDRGTSGVILVARDNKTLELIRDQFRRRTVKKQYRAIVDGRIEDETIKVDVPIGRQQSNPVLRRPDPSGKRAVTEIVRKGVNDGTSAVYCYPHTGRTHQIRVHCKYLGHPILGDDKYNDSSSERLMLHAESIEISHPETGEKLKVTNSPPDEVNRRWYDIVTRSQ